MFVTILHWGNQSGHLILLKICRFFLTGTKAAVVKDVYFLAPSLHHPGCNLSARVKCSSCIYWISIHFIQEGFSLLLHQTLGEGRAGPDRREFFVPLVLLTPKLLHFVMNLGTPPRSRCQDTLSAFSSDKTSIVLIDIWGWGELTVSAVGEADCQPGRIFSLVWDGLFFFFNKLFLFCCLLVQISVSSKPSMEGTAEMKWTLFTMPS